MIELGGEHLVRGDAHVERGQVERFELVHVDAPIDFDLEVRRAQVFVDLVKPLHAN